MSEDKTDPSAFTPRPFAEARQELWTLADIRAHLNISKERLDKWIQEGRLFHAVVRTPGGIRYRAILVKKLLDQDLEKRFPKPGADLNSPDPFSWVQKD